MREFTEPQFREPISGSGFTIDQRSLEFAAALHDLCQPLTTLQCLLEVGQMDATPEALADAIRGALVQCARMNRDIRVQQERLLRSNRPATKEHSEQVQP